MRLGGPAAYFVEVKSEEDLRAALAGAENRKVPAMILGGGSNVIFADTGYAGLIIRMASRGITIERETDHNVQIRVAAGEIWDNFAEHCVSKNLYGVECLSGIPGTVGGVPIQNVGAYGQEARNTIVSVRCFDRNESRVLNLTADECAFGYRTSRFKHADAGRFVVLDVLFSLAIEPGLARYPELIRTLESPSFRSIEPVALRTRLAVLHLRRGKSMVVDPGDPDSVSCGSFFTNPILHESEYEGLIAKIQNKGIVPPNVFSESGGLKIPAAWLVENSGFAKGYTENGAGISSKHALALVNRGATAKTLMQLARNIQDRVYETFGVRLAMEPEYIR